MIGTKRHDGLNCESDIRSDRNRHNGQEMDGKTKIFSEVICQVTLHLY